MLLIVAPVIVNVSIALHQALPRTQQNPILHEYVQYNIYIFTTSTTLALLGPDCTYSKE